MKQLRLKTSLTILVAFIAIFAITLTGCTKAKEKGPEVIKIGAILPLTGPIAFLGVPVKNAIALAVEEINKEGGINEKKIKVLYEDSAGQAKNAVQAMNKLVDIDKTKIVFAFLTSIIETVKPIADQKNVLLLAQSVYPPVVEGSKNTFRIFYSFKDEAMKITNYIRASNVRKLAFIRSRDSATEYEVTKYIIPELKKLNIEFVDETFNVGSKDFKVQVAKSKSINPNMLIILGFGSDFPGVLKELEQQKVKDLEIVGGIGFIEIPKDKIPDNILNNLTFFVPPYYVESNKNQEQFKKKYSAKYNTEDISYSAAYAYDNIFLLAKALEASESTDLNDIKNAFSKIKEYDGITGSIELLSNGDSKVEVARVAYMNGMLKRR